MFKRANPANNAFFQLISHASEILLEVTNLLEEIVNAEPENRPALRDKLHDLEHKADGISHEVSTKLNQTFVTPLDRDDIQLLVSSLDDCIDYADDAGDMIVLYDLQDIPRRLSQQVSILKKCAELTAEYMPRISDIHGLREYWVEINRLENEGDRVYRKQLAELFQTTYDPITIIKVKDIMERLERGVDCFEHLAQVVETIAIKES